MNKWQPELERRSGPKYLAVLDTLERDILNGTLAPGDRLPPQRQIAEYFGVTISTVTKVFTEASRRGLVEATPGSGTFIAAAHHATQSSGSFVDMGINLVPHALCGDHLKAGMLEYIETTAGADMLGYTGYHLQPGSPGHRFAGWLTDRLCPHTACSVLMMSNGTQQGLVAAIQCLSEPGDTVLCEAQTFTGILRTAQQERLIAHGIEMDDQGVCPDALERGFKDTGAKLVVLVPTAQNPTGAIMSDERRRKIASLVRKYDAFLIEDAVAAPLAGADVSSIFNHAPQNCIYITGASKCIASGVRFGVMRVPQALAGRVHEALLASNWMGPTYFAGFTDLLVKSGRMDSILSIYRADVVSRHDLVQRYLGAAPGSPFTYHCWHLLPSSVPAQTIVAEAAGANLRLSAADPFCCPNITAPNALRLCLGAQSDIRTLEMGLERLSRLLAKARPLATPII